MHDCGVITAHKQCKSSIILHLFHFHLFFTVWTCWAKTQNLLSWFIISFIAAENWLTGAYMQKSINLEYNTLVRWADGTNISSTMCVMFHVLFLFHKILQNSLEKPFQFIFLFFIRLWKWKEKFWVPKFIENYERNTV